MQWLSAGVIGAMIGSTIGWTAEHLAIASVIQSLVAFTLAFIVGEISILLGWSPGWKSGHAGYWAVGVDNLFRLAILCALAAAVHVALGRFGAASFDALVSHRPIILGSAGGLWGAMSGAWLMHAVIRRQGSWR